MYATKDDLPPGGNSSLGEHVIIIRVYVISVDLNENSFGIGSIESRNLMCYRPCCRFHIWTRKHSGRLSNTFRYFITAEGMRCLCWGC